jgi:hypothetical protein
MHVAGIINQDAKTYPIYHKIKTSINLHVDFKVNN